MKSIEFLEQRAKCIESAHAIIAKVEAEQRDATVEENNEFDALTKQADELKAKADFEERKETANKLSASLTETRRKVDVSAGSIPARLDNTHEFRSAVNAWAKHTVTRLDSRETNLLDRSGFSGRSIELRALTVGGGLSTGGSTVPTEYSGEIEKALAYFCPIRNFCDVRRTDNSGPYVIPNISAVSLSTAVIGENVTASEKDPTFNEQTFRPKRFAAYCKVSNELLRDSKYDLASEIVAALGEVIARSQATLFSTTGTGLTTALLEGAVDSGARLDISDGYVTPDSLYDMYFSVDAAYRDSPKAAWVMTDLVWSKIAGMREGNTTGTMMHTDLKSGPEKVLLGKPVVIENNLGNSFGGGSQYANQKPIIFGDLSKFVIIDVDSIRITRDESLGLLENYTYFVVSAYADCGYKTPSSVSPIMYGMMQA